MIKGFYQKRIDRMAHEIALYDDAKNVFYTFEFKVHEAAPRHVVSKEETSLFKMDGESEQILRAVAEVFIQMGLLNDSATGSPAIRN